MLGAFGQIGTQKAVDVLVATSRTTARRCATRRSSALGATHSEQAEKMLVELSRQNGDPAQNAAIGALGTLGTDNAVARLIELANMQRLPGRDQRGLRARQRRARRPSEPALRKLVDSPDSRVAAAALGVDRHDRRRAAREAHDDRQVAATRSSSTPRSRRSATPARTALPVLREAALHGGQNARWAAVNAIGEIGGDKAIAILGEILKTGDRQAATSAAQALAQHRRPGGARAADRGGALRSRDR